MKFRSFSALTLLPAGILLQATLALASSHREAPGIASDPAADNTDLYAWVCSEDGVRSLCIVANYNPLELPEGGFRRVRRLPTVGRSNREIG